jgi:hypothetical protein
MNGIVTEVIVGIEPVIITVLSSLLMTALTWAILQFERMTKLKIEESRRNALHSAIMTGVRSAVTRLGDGVPTDVVAKEAVAYARASVPDAIAALKPGVEVLTQIALAKLEEALTAPAHPEGF